MQESSFKIPIDGQWELSDLYGFSKPFEECYYAYNAIRRLSSDEMPTPFTNAFAQYPWQGGYSAFNFYQALKRSTPKHERPAVKSLQYSSPGVIDLALHVPTALQMAGVIVVFAKTFDAVNSAYNNIYKRAQERRLLKIEVESRALDLATKRRDLVKAFSKDEENSLEFLREQNMEYFQELGIEERRAERLSYLGQIDSRKLRLEVQRSESERTNKEFIDDSNQELDEILDLAEAMSLDDNTGSALVSLKVKLSLCRRLRVLAEYQRNGKTKL